MVIKVIEGMEPWEVMKAASEHEADKLVRIAARKIPNAAYDKQVWREQSTPAFAWDRNDYAIIDESQPSIDWGGVKWEFFEPYGGLPVIFKGIRTFSHGYEDGDEEYTDLCESPLYPWTGGECPVPGNVEVEVKVVEEDHDVNAVVLTREVGKASAFVWDENDDRLPIGDIIAFRITGRVL